MDARSVIWFCDLRLVSLYNGLRLDAALIWSWVHCTQI